MFRIAGAERYDSAHDGVWWHPFGAPDARLCLEGFTGSIAYQDLSSRSAGDMPKVGWFKSFFYFAAEVESRGRRQWVLINKRSAQHWLKRCGHTSRFRSVEAVFQRVVCAKQADAPPPPPLGELVEAHWGELSRLFKEKGEVIEKLRELYRPEAALRILLTWQRLVEQTPWLRGKGGLEAWTLYLIALFDKSPRILDEQIEGFVQNFVQTLKIYIHVRNYTSTPFEELLHLVEFIEEKKGRIDWTDEEGDYRLFRPRETGLARSIFFFSDGTIIIQFNRRSHGDVIIGEGSYSSVKTAWNYTEGVMVAFSVASSRGKGVETTRNGYEVASAIEPGCGVVAIRRRLIKPSKKGGEKFVVIMNYLSGGCLGRLFREGRLGEIDVDAVVSDVLAGLERTHAADVIHADVKLENILLDSLGNARLADFGLSSRVERVGGFGRHLAGTSSCKAPEQLRRDNPDGIVHKKHDIFSMGGVLWTLWADDVAPYFRWRTFEDRWSDLSRRAEESRVLPRKVDARKKEIDWRVGIMMNSPCWMLAEGVSPERLEDLAQRGDVSAEKALLISRMLAPCLRDRPDASAVRHYWEAIRRGNRSLA